MTNFNTTDINTFCMSDIYIPTFDETEEETWFILSEKLLAALELPDGVELAELLTEAAYRTQMPACPRDESDTGQFVSERGLYALIFMTTAPTFQNFRDWALQVVMPIIMEDGIYILKEEDIWMPPTIEDEDEDLSLTELFAMMNEVLPEVRKCCHYSLPEHQPQLVKMSQSHDPNAERNAFLQALKGHRLRRD